MGRWHLTAALACLGCGSAASKSVADAQPQAPADATAATDDAAPGAVTIGAAGGTVVGGGGKVTLVVPPGALGSGFRSGVSGRRGYLLRPL